jgi:hypothetical protein
VTRVNFFWSVAPVSPPWGRTSQGQPLCGFALLAAGVTNTAAAAPRSTAKQHGTVAGDSKVVGYQARRLCFSCRRTERRMVTTDPMTRRNMRANGVRSLLVNCLNVHCRHEAIVSMDGLSEDISVRSLGLRMRGQRCGQRGADVRPNWNERHKQAPITRSSGIAR